MAAFINALGEEGTLSECRDWVRKLREENDRQFNPKGTMNLSKDECIKELKDLFYYEHKRRKLNESSKYRPTNGSSGTP